VTSTLYSLTDDTITDNWPLDVAAERETEAQHRVITLD
jgi:hypothetical protein